MGSIEMGKWHLKFRLFHISKFNVIHFLCNNFTIMSTSVRKQAILLLEDGTIQYGQAFGKIGTATGEICFNTGMTGYQEVFTDPSYYGQIIIMNSVHIGNYGVKDEDIESDNVKIRGLIGRNLEDQYSG